MKHSKLIGFTAALLMASSVATLVHAQIKDAYLHTDGLPQRLDPNAVDDADAGGFLAAAGGISGKPIAALAGGGVVGLSFKGVDLEDTISVGGGFIPPDTMGAIGRTQYMEFVNGGVGVFDKATGTRTALVGDVAWWAAAGQTGASGDSRVLYNKDADRWIALSFGGNPLDIQVAVSDTSDALGSWKSTSFQGYAGLGLGGLADYPTLALDKNAVYIGTNNYATNAGGGYDFKGTSLNVIPLSNLFSAGAPTTSGLVRFDTPCCAAGYDQTHGFAIQGVNSGVSRADGLIVASSIASNNLSVYSIKDAGTAGATRTAGTFVGGNYQANGAARQPGFRDIDALDDRTSSSIWEQNGRIYSVHTITKLGDNFTSIRYDVIDSATFALLDEGDIGGGGFDYYQGSLAVNSDGQVVIAYNRSGNAAADGNISFRARTFDTNGLGQLLQTGSELILQSSANTYHLGGAPHRWGDYSSVTIDPLNSHSFWAIGEYSQVGPGRSSWSTWISQINVPGIGGAVPEPATWAMMILGFGLVGVAARRRRVTQA